MIKIGKYANNTTVSPEKSQNDIRDTLRRYGAKKFGVMEEDDKAHVMFEYSNLMIQITITLPNRKEFEKTDTERERKASIADKAYNQAVRQHWRSLLLAIKAKLEAVECKISTIEQEFMAFVIMPDGRNLGEHIIPKLKDMSATGKMPKLLTDFRKE
ncbi:MAG: hypothetical protein LBQ89_07955 [Treponema sp.]|nr:hypothetical protein [Treponema sp.]